MGYLCSLCNCIHIKFTETCSFLELLLLASLLVGFLALRPKSTAMVIAGRSVHLTTLFPGQALTSG